MGTPNAHQTLSSPPSPNQFTNPLIKIKKPLKEIDVPFPLTDELENLKRKYKTGRVENVKPPNCFMLFRKAFMKVLSNNGYFLPAKSVSSLASEKWKNKSVAVKDDFRRISREIAQSLKPISCNPIPESQNSSNTLARKKSISQLQKKFRKDKAKLKYSSKKMAYTNPNKSILSKTENSEERSELSSLNYPSISLRNSKIQEDNNQQLLDNKFSPSEFQVSLTRDEIKYSNGFSSDPMNEPFWIFDSNCSDPNLNYHPIIQTQPDSEHYYLPKNFNDSEYFTNQFCPMPEFESLAQMPPVIYEKDQPSCVNFARKSYHEATNWDFVMEEPEDFFEISLPFFTAYDVPTDWILDSY
ncbi:hypothetical protein G9A89_010276 [Geosiphon pyriformis]|nr:hypothetical protein G9A89_010276 [Geosiphon pyriformis]